MLGDSISPRINEAATFHREKAALSGSEACTSEPEHTIRALALIEFEHSEAAQQEPCIFRLECCCDFRPDQHCFWHCTNVLCHVTDFARHDAHCESKSISGIPAALFSLFSCGSFTELLQSTACTNQALICTRPHSRGLSLERQLDIRGVRAA